MPEAGSYSAYDHKRWSEAGLKDYGDYADVVEYVDQSEYGDGQLEGSWYYEDVDTLTIYHGTFGNYNSPGADSYTYAEVFETTAEFIAALEVWQAKEEYLETEDEEEDE